MNIGKFMHIYTTLLNNKIILQGVLKNTNLKEFDFVSTKNDKKLEILHYFFQILILFFLQFFYISVASIANGTTDRQDMNLVSSISSWVASNFNPNLRTIMTVYRSVSNDV